MQEYVRFIKTLAEETGGIIKKYYRSDLKIETKKDLSPVTIADKKSEEKMREMIQKEFPEHGVLGEEFGETNPNAEYKWILDPIDGTKSFICGTPLFGTLIALTKNGSPILGAINFPVLDEFLYGDNSAAYLNGKRVSVRETRNLSQAVLLTTDQKHVFENQNRENFEKLVSKINIYRTWGDCYGYYLLATGYADIMLDPIMSIWDTMALIPVIQGAGGIISDWRGNDVVKGTSVAAASKALHPEVIKTLNG